MEHAREANVQLKADGNGDLTAVLHVSFRCDEHGHHNLKKEAQYEAVTRIYDPWEWLQDALMCMVDEGCCGAGWRPWDGSKPAEGCEWRDR